MKQLTIALTILLFISLTFLYLSYSELSKENELRQRELNGLKKRNALERDSLERQLNLTKDSLNIAFETIRLASKERQEAHERSQQTIANLKKIIFIAHTDSSRSDELKQLYKTYTP